MGKKNKERKTGKKAGPASKKQQVKNNVFKVANKVTKNKKTREIPKKLKQVNLLEFLSENSN
jgi:hypothetical protein